MIRPHDDALAFEHISEFELGTGLAIADAGFIASSFDDTRRGNLALAYSFEVEPGPWHAFEASDENGLTRFVLLCHESELGDDAPSFDQAESPGLLTVDTDRILAIDATHRDEPAIQSAVRNLGSRDLPGTVSGVGVACGVAEPGRYPLYVSREQPRTVVFVAFDHD